MGRKAISALGIAGPLSGSEVLPIVQAGATKNKAVADFQVQDDDLDAIAALSPADDDIIQRKGGVWVKRTLAQFMADIQQRVSLTTGAFDSNGNLDSMYTYAVSKLSVTDAVTGMPDTSLDWEGIVFATGNRSSGSLEILVRETGATNHNKGWYSMSVVNGTEDAGGWQLLISKSYADTLYTPITSGSVSTGQIVETAFRTPDAGYLSCDGSAVSRSTYATLFAKIVPTVGTFTVTIATPGVFTLNSHGFMAGDKIYFTTTGALPTGLSPNTIYYVISSGLTANAFQVSATRGGSAINTTGSQSGVHTCLHCPYGLGDGSTTFNVPDRRSAAGRGVGTPTGFTQNTAVAGGEVIDDKFQGHHHQSWGGTGGANAQSLVDWNTGDTSLQNVAKAAVSDGTNGTPRTGSETTGKALGVYYHIKT